MTHTYIKQAVFARDDGLDEVRDTVSAIISDVRDRGEDAVRDYSRKFDKWSPDSFSVPSAEVAAAETKLPSSVADAIRFSAAQIETFARAQLAHIQDFEIETIPGVWLGQRTIPVGSVGSYTPGGRYPLIASALMTIIPPRIAGVKRVIACSPPRTEEGIHPPTLFAMGLAGVSQVYCIGGVQALAAMAYGVFNEEARVDMVVGAGNAYVSEAKRQLFGQVGVDLLAGPTEIMIIADDSADPHLLAIDLLSQAEHDVRSPAILVTTSQSLGKAVQEEVDRLLVDYPTAAVAGPAWRDFGEIIVTESLADAVALSDRFGPEHLELHTRDDQAVAKDVRVYGSLFVGEETTVTYGDKAIGTNHVLPTLGAARYTGGLWVGKFMKTVTTQRVDRRGSAAVGRMASVVSRAEEMIGHALSAEVRVGRYGGDES